MRATIGLNKTTTFQLRTDGECTEVELAREDGSITKVVEIQGWTAIVVLATRRDNQRAPRMLVMAPGEEQRTFTHGAFGLEGAFEIVETENNPRRATTGFKASELPLVR